VFDDDAALDQPDVGGLSSRAYRPGDFQPGDSLPAPAPAAPYLSTLAGLDTGDPNGTWRLWADDDSTPDVGAIAGGWCGTPTTVAPVPECNNGTITIPAGAPGTTSGVAAPYPSTFTVAGAGGVIAKATITLNRVNHTFPDDLDILLVSPAGQKIMLMSDAGGG